MILHLPFRRQVIAFFRLQTTRRIKQFNSNSLSLELPNPCFVDNMGEMMYLRPVFVTSLCIYVITMSYSIGARQALCKFFKSIAQIIPEGHEYCFTVRGNNAMSLSNLTMPTDEYFAFGLLISGVLKLRKRSQGGWHVEEARRKTRTTTMTTTTAHGPRH